MTQFVIVNPTLRETTAVNFEDLRDAEIAAGLNPDAIDHGSVRKMDGGLIGIVVYEYGLFVPPEQQSYFALGGQLYAGIAVLYGVGETGETVDLSLAPTPTWLPTRVEVELAISAGICRRPKLAVNGDVHWQWPGSAPF